LRSGRLRLKRSQQEGLVGYAFLLPDLIGLTAFVIIPIIVGAYYRLHDWDGLSSPTYVGLDNYRELAQDPNFMSSLRLTAIYVLAFVPLVFIVSLSLALILNQRLKGAAFFRTAYFLPVLVSLVVASAVWSLILVGKGGALNIAIGAIGIPPQAWLKSTNLAMISIVIVTVWQALGYNTIIFLAGLQDVPKEYIEAASIDGAGPRQRFRRITLPLLRPTSVFVVVTSAIAAFQLFDAIYTMTSGGPAGATRVAVFLIYDTAFKLLRIGYGSAMAIVLFAIILVFTVIQLRVLRSG
jgi:multiple sugar transport system permease protein